jgi:hypothetical protein
MLELQVGDLFGIPPNSKLEKFICKVLGAKTFHWGIIIGKDDAGYITSESLGKGTAVTRYEYPVGHIYRIKGLQATPSLQEMVSIHSARGECVYDMEVNFLTGIWFLLKHYLKIVIPIIHNHIYNCQEWVVYFAAMLGFKIIRDDEYPYCINLENSTALEYLGERHQ